MRDGITKHSLVVRGHKTSITMEDGFWEALRGIAHVQGRRLCDIAAEVIDQDKVKTLSAGMRLYVLAYYQERCAA